MATESIPQLPMVPGGVTGAEQLEGVASDGVTSVRILVRQIANLGGPPGPPGPTGPQGPQGVPTVPGVNNIGYENIPQNHQAGNYTLGLSDSGEHIYHDVGDGAATWTIPANASVAFPIGTAVTFINLSATSVSIAITMDTLYLAGAGTTGTRTLAQYGSATALKITSTKWIITGTNLT